MSIFISYSRHDSAFVRRLHEALVARGRDTWVDWEGIAPTADWMNEIRGAIDAAEAFAFVLSPDSAASPVCAQELAHALAHNKRLIPLLLRTVDSAQVPPALAPINWLAFRDSDDFDAAVQTLLTAVDTDLDWVQAHTRLLVRAAEWERRGHEKSLALRGADLKAAEQWLTLGPTKTPSPTALQTRYIIDSRREATRSRTLRLGLAMAALVAMAVLGTLFLLQRTESARQEAIASARRLAAVSERLQSQPPQQPPEGDPVVLRVRLAAEGLRRVLVVGQRSLEADLALRRALAVLPQRSARLVPAGAPKDFDAIVFGAEGELVAASRQSATASAWRADGGEPKGGGVATRSAEAAVLSPDGCCAAFTVIAPGVVEVELRDARSYAPLAEPLRIERLEYDSVVLSPGGALLLANSALPDAPGGERRSITRLWQRDGRDWRELLALPPMMWATFSPDGDWLAASVDDRALVWSTARLRTGDAAPQLSLADRSPPPGAPRGAPLFSADGRHLAVAFGDDPSRIGLWTVGDWQAQPTLGAGAGWLAAVGPAGRTLATAQVRGSGYLVRIVDTATGRDLAHAMVSTRNAVAAFDARGDTLALGVEGAVDLLRVRRGGVDVERFTAPAGTAALAFVDGDERLALLTHSGEGPTRRYQLQHRDAGTSTAAPPIDLGAAHLARFSADGRWVLLAAGQALRVAAAHDGQLQRRATAQGQVRAVALSADARQLVAASDGTRLELWNAHTPLSTATTAMPAPLEGRAPALATDGRRVVAVTLNEKATRIGQSSDIRVWSAPTLQDAASLPLGRDRSGLAADLCALSGDGRLLAVHSGGTRVTVRQTDGGGTVGSVDEAGTRPLCAFSPDGRTLAVGRQSVRVWDIGSQQETAMLESAAPQDAEADDGAGTLRALSFSASGHRLATLQQDGSVAVWRLDAADLLAQTCARLQGEMHPTDWERFVGAQPQQPLCP